MSQPVTKNQRQFSAGGIQRTEASIHASNIALADPKTGEATRVGMKTMADGKKSTGC